MEKSKLSRAAKSRKKLKRFEKALPEGYVILGSAGGFARIWNPVTDHHVVMPLVSVN